ncbi:MAG: hypothetical protein QXE05_09735 [Nitrososphaeria archaeon]
MPGEGVPPAVRLNLHPLPILFLSEDGRGSSSSSGCVAGGNGKDHVSLPGGSTGPHHRRLIAFPLAIMGPEHCSLPPARWDNVGAGE